MIIEVDAIHFDNIRAIVEVKKKTDFMMLSTMYNRAIYKADNLLAIIHDGTLHEYHENGSKE